MYSKNLGNLGYFFLKKSVEIQEFCVKFVNIRSEKGCFGRHKRLKHHFDSETGRVGTELHISRM